MTATPAKTVLDRVMLPPTYQQSRAHIIPSINSLQWTMRTRREELVKAGALLFIQGRWMIDSERFDAWVLEAGARAARREGQPA